MPLRLHFAMAFLGCSAGLLWCSQSAPRETAATHAIPESGFISPSKYTNEFFGFSLPIPQGIDLHEQTLSLKRGTLDHFLLGFHAPDRGLVSFAITAKEVHGATKKEAKKLVAGLDSKPRETKIGGMLFWKSESPSQTNAGEMQRLAFSTSMNNYVLKFELVSFSPQTTNEIQRDVEQLMFFDPSKARLMAGVDSKPYMPGAPGFPASRIGQVSSGSVSGNTYHNADLGFRYQFPVDWVLMSKASDEGTDSYPFLSYSSPLVQNEHEREGQCAKNLLFVRRYLENPATGQFNPMVLLLAADPRCFSGPELPAADDHDANQQLARQVVLYFKTDTMTPSGEAAIRAFSDAGRRMIEISQSFNLSVPGQTAPLTVLTSIWIMQAGDVWVIWLFASGNNTDLQELRDTKIFFDDRLVPTTEGR
jgi:hypothetical protein